MCRSSRFLKALHFPSPMVYHEYHIMKHGSVLMLSNCNILFPSSLWEHQILYVVFLYENLIWEATGLKQNEKMGMPWCKCNLQWEVKLMRNKRNVKLLPTLWSKCRLRPCWLMKAGWRGFLSFSSFFIFEEKLV